MKFKTSLRKIRICGNKIKKNDSDGIVSSIFLHEQAIATYAISTIRSFSWGARAITGKNELALCSCEKIKCENCAQHMKQEKFNATSQQHVTNLKPTYHVKTSHIFRSGTNWHLWVIHDQTNLRIYRKVLQILNTAGDKRGGGKRCR